MSLAEAARPRASRSSGSAAPPPDFALVARLRAGDEGAFEAIFHRYHLQLLSFCRHTLGSRDDAEDALQQTFIRAHRALLADSFPRELRPWLYAIARNCCISAIGARRPVANIDDHEPSLAGLSDEVRDREDLRELVADLQALPEDQRSALLLAELDDLPHHEIAAIAECPVNKVKALIHQARTTLIAQRDARATPCVDIRTQLSLARGGELRRGPLRRHLGLCSGCRDYAAAVRAQRLSLAVILPAIPSAGLAARVLGHTALHIGGLGGAGGLGVAGGVHGAAGTLTTGGASVAGSGAVTAGAAGASGSAAGASAVLGGGLAAKLAIGGAVAVIASAGAATTLRHITHHHRSATTARSSTRAPAHAAGTSASAPGALGSAARLIAAGTVAGARAGGARTASGPRAAGQSPNQRRIARRRLQSRRRALALRRRRRPALPASGQRPAGKPGPAARTPHRRRADPVRTAPTGQGTGAAHHPRTRARASNQRHRSAGRHAGSGGRHDGGSSRGGGRGAGPAGRGRRRGMRSPAAHA